jgi:hypothetical protein
MMCSMESKQDMFTKERVRNDVLHGIETNNNARQTTVVDMHVQRTLAAAACPAYLNLKVILSSVLYQVI